MGIVQATRHFLSERGYYLDSDDKLRLLGKKLQSQIATVIHVDSGHEEADLFAGTLDPFAKSDLDAMELEAEGTSEEAGLERAGAEPDVEMSPADRKPLPPTHSPHPSKEPNVLDYPPPPNPAPCPALKSMDPNLVKILNF